jgi:sortase A
VRRVVAGVGRTLITLGILTLLFVAYQLWGTGLYTSREQDTLRDELTALIRRTDPVQVPTTTSLPSASTTTTTGPTPLSTTTTTTLPIPAPPPGGDALAILRIPSIGLDTVVVEGIRRADLRKGPGHFPDSPLPGQEGNSAIAGHRVTYGAPFGDLDLVENGDEIIVRTVTGTYTYEVFDKQVVNPSDISVLDPPAPGSGDGILTLTTCNPKFSTAQRLVVQARLPDNETPLPSGRNGTPDLSESDLSGEGGSTMPTVYAGLIAALIGAMWWLGFHRHPRWTTWFLGAVPFAVSLAFFYFFLERVLPTNY